MNFSVMTFNLDLTKKPLMSFHGHWPIRLRKQMQNFKL